MHSKYVVDGKVARGRIALDIKFRHLKHDDIMRLAKITEIKESFFGGEFKHKKPQKQWDKEYLNLVSHGANAECFNLEYMLYLNEVAEHVVKIKRKKMIIAGVVLLIIIVIIAGVVHFSVAKAASAASISEITNMAVKKAFGTL